MQLTSVTFSTLSVCVISFDRCRHMCDYCE